MLKIQQSTASVDLLHNKIVARLCFTCKAFCMYMYLQYVQILSYGYSDSGAAQFLLKGIVHGHFLNVFKLQKATGRLKAEPTALNVHVCDNMWQKARNLQQLVSNLTIVVQGSVYKSTIEIQLSCVICYFSCICTDTRSLQLIEQFFTTLLH